MQSNNSANTDKAYNQAWKVFSAWCDGVGLSPLPATAETVATFAMWCLYERARRYRLGTVNLTFSAIRHRHSESEMPIPVTPEVRRLVRNAARDLRERKRQKKALTPEQLRAVCKHLSGESPIDARDRAMFLLQFAAGWRCGEVTGLQLSDVAFTDKGFIVSLGASKSDQLGRDGREVGIPLGQRQATCPVRALRAWIKIRGTAPGALFCRLSPGHTILPDKALIYDHINERLKVALAALGVDARHYGSHSLRAGMVTAGIEAGASETSIMLRTGHKSLDTMRRYVRIAKAFSDANPLKGVL